MRLVLKLLKAVFDVLASYLLAWVLLFALVGWGLWLLVGLALPTLGFETHEGLWLWIDRSLPLPGWSVRLVLFGALHAGLYFALRRPLRRLVRALERRVDRLLERYRGWAKRHGRAAASTSVGFSLAVGALLVPFVIQPTMVAGWRPASWGRRLANLVDGSASAAIVESVIGLYRRIGARPVLGEAVSAEAFDRAVAGAAPPRSAAGKQPLMDRWDARIRAITGGAPRDFAALKAVMWVESAGEQFAVSHTGCVGLMQFCSRTARTGVFRKIFGVGRIYPCNCGGRGRCRVSRATRRALESGRLDAVSGFPCDMSDARFDPDRAIRAGWTYIRSLRAQLGGDLLLAYIGYNSGPALARSIYRALGRRALRPGELPSVRRLAPHVEPALRGVYRGSAARRARGLVRVHLPKLARAYRLYLAHAMAARRGGAGAATGRSTR